MSDSRRIIGYGALGVALLGTMIAAARLFQRRGSPVQRSNQAIDRILVRAGRRLEHLGECTKHGRSNGKSEEFCRCIDMTVSETRDKLMAVGEELKKELEMAVE